MNLLLGLALCLVQDLECPWVWLYDGSGLLSLALSLVQDLECPWVWLYDGSGTQVPRWRAW